MEVEKYVWEIETEGKYFKYLLWSLYCNQPESCQIKISFEKVSRSEKKMIYMAIIFSISSLVLCVIGFFVIRHLRKYKAARQIKRQVLAHSNEMERLYPKVNVVELPNEITQCSICLQDFSEESSGRVLPCHHVFHQNCIDSWTALKNSCPVCKRLLQDLTE